MTIKTMIAIDKYGVERELRDGENLRDGERLRVGMLMRDGRTVDADQLARSLGLKDSAALHRPGYRHAQLGEDALARKRQAYLDAEKRASNAWRGEPEEDPDENDPDDDSDEQRDRRRRTKTTQTDPQGRLQSTFSTEEDAARLTDKQRAYISYDRRMADAWRNPLGTGDRPRTLDGKQPMSAADAYMAYDLEQSQRWRNAR